MSENDYFRYSCMCASAAGMFSIINSIIIFYRYGTYFPPMIDSMRNFIILFGWWDTILGCFITILSFIYLMRRERIYGGLASMFSVLSIGFIGMSMMTGIFSIYFLPNNNTKSHNKSM